MSFLLIMIIYSLRVCESDKQYYDLESHKCKCKPGYTGDKCEIEGNLYNFNELNLRLVYWN